MFEYRAFVTSVYDGDTITVDVDLGFRAHQKKIKLRLFGINAPEMRGAEKANGIITRNWLRRRVLNKQVVLKTYKDKTGKYGRWLADIYPIDDQSKSFNQMMVDEGLAVAATY